MSVDFSFKQHTSSRMVLLLLSSDPRSQNSASEYSIRVSCHLYLEAYVSGLRESVYVSSWTVVRK